MASVSCRPCCGDRRGLGTGMRRRKAVRCSVERERCADPLWLAPWQKGLREAAAKIQEVFDCDVLSLPWHDLKVGRPVDPERVASCARKYERVALRHGPLHNWYPVGVGTLPIASARMVCQRINCWWDVQQRKRYVALVTIAMCTLVAAACVLGLATKMVLTDFVLIVGAPCLPLLVVAVRQIKENGEATTRLEKLKEHAESMWNRFLSGAESSALETESRALQDEIFDARKRNFPVLDLLYNRLRPDQERDMNAAAGGYIQQASKAPARSA